jgi:hypothetical protein
MPRRQDSGASRLRQPVNDGPATPSQGAKGTKEPLFELATVFMEAK